MLQAQPTPPLRHHTRRTIDTPLPTSHAPSLPVHAALLRLALQEAAPQLREALLARRTRRLEHRIAAQARSARSPPERRLRQAEAARRAGGAGDRAGAGEASFLALLFGPGEEGGDELEYLEFLRVGAVEGEEMDEVVGYDLAGYYQYADVDKGED